MRNNKIRYAAAGLMLIFIATFIGCQSHTSPSDLSGSSSKTIQPIHASTASDASSKGGAQLWQENCSRCHNLRPPQYYSDQQWSVVVQHMRFRANLTGLEQRKITEFLQASN